MKHDQAKLRGFSPIVELEESGYKEVVFFNYAVFSALLNHSIDMDGKASVDHDR